MVPVPQDLSIGDLIVLCKTLDEEVTEGRCNLRILQQRSAVAQQELAMRQQVIGGMPAA